MMPSLLHKAEIRLHPDEVIDQRFCSCTLGYRALGCLRHPEMSVARLNLRGHWQKHFFDSHVEHVFAYFASRVLTGQSSVRKGTAGRSAWLYRLQAGLTSHA